MSMNFTGHGSCLGLSWADIQWFCRGNGRAYKRRLFPREGREPRLVEMPVPELDAAHKELCLLMRDWPAHDAAHAYERGCSQKTCMEPHQGSVFLLCMDLEDFFHQFTFARVKGFFRSKGYDEQTAYTMALIATARKGGRAGGFPRRLPVGGRHSPRLSNLIFAPVDEAVERAVAPLAYTRYADDLFFSADYRHQLEFTAGKVKRVVEKSGFRVNTDKTRILECGAGGKVLGIEF